MRDGDAFLLNDPYDGGTHLPDITLAVPVFADGRVGGAGLHDVPPPGRGRPHAGQRADRRHRALPGGRDHPAHPALPRRRARREPLRACSRATCACPTCSPATSWPRWRRAGSAASACNELFAAHGAATVLGVHRRAARAGRAAHARARSRRSPTATTPSPTGSTTTASTSDRPVKIAVTLRVRGSAMTFDFTGSDPQVRGPFNSVPASTMSAVYYAVRAISDAVDPEQRRLLPRRRRGPPGGHDRQPAAAGAGELPDGDHQAHRRHDPGRAGRARCPAACRRRTRARCW